MLRWQGDTMIVQACINGARPPDYHAALPLTAAAMAKDGLAAIEAGAAELHIHPRGPDGRENLAAVDATMLAVRRLCPGTLVGVSTGAWIEGDVAKTRAAIAAWHERPDYASVNLSEPDAPAIIALLSQIGVGVEAGLATVADAERLLSMPDPRKLFRILIEIEEQDFSCAEEIAAGIAAKLDSAGLHRPILLHGFDATVWHFVHIARKNRWSTRVGLEDGAFLADGSLAVDNAALVAQACRIYRDGTF